MTNIRYLEDYKAILLTCKGCNSIECICADLELGELIAHEWFKSDDCDGVCNRCWFVNDCIGSDCAIPIHLLRKEVIP